MTEFPFLAVCIDNHALIADVGGMLGKAGPDVRDDWLLTVGKVYKIVGEKLGMYVVVNNTGTTSLHPRPYFRPEEQSSA